MSYGASPQIEWGFQSKKEKKGFLVLFRCFVEIESCEHQQNHAYNAFYVIRRKYLVSWVVRCQYCIADQECGEQYDDYSQYKFIYFHESSLSAVFPYNSLRGLRRREWKFCWDKSELLV